MQSWVRNLLILSMVLFASMPAIGLDDPPQAIDADPCPGDWPKDGEVVPGYTCPSGRNDCGTNEHIQFSAEAFPYLIQPCDRFAWNFGDGKTSTARNPIHAYGATGTYQVTLRISNSKGGATAANLITIARAGFAPPAIEHTWVPKTPTVGNPVLFSAATTNGEAALNWEWTFSDLSGFHPGEIELHYFEEAGSYAVTTRAFTTRGVSVKQSTIQVLPRCKPPTIDLQPTSQYVKLNEQATMTVEASGSTTLKYQWFIGEPGDLSNPIFGATAAKFVSLPMIEDTKFWVRISNDCGFVESESVTVFVDVNCKPPVIVSQTLEATVDRGETTILHVEAGGTEPFVYQWFKNGSPISDGVESTWRTRPLYETTFYKVRVTNACGEVMSEEIIVKVGSARRRGVR